MILTDKVKVQLAKSDLCKHMLTLLRKSEDAPEYDRVQMEKMVSDLVVLLLTGNESMDVLYGNGEGEVFNESLRWLESSSEQLHISGALAIGNFARNDCHCIKLVEAGITSKLLTLLERDVSMSDMMPHAVFSALRNLAIPAINKSAMLKCGLIDHLLTHINTEYNSVQFKLLGTMRMAIDGQAAAAHQMGTNEEFLEKLVSWCTVEEHAGVKGEANRLVAWLVKHSRSGEVMTLIAKHGGLPHLVTMATSEHAVMQNEALVALTLIASTVLDKVSDDLAKADLVPTVKVLLTEDDTLPEIMCNVLTLVNAITKSAELVQLLHIADIHVIVKGLTKHSEAMVATQAKAVATVLGKG